MNTWTAAITSSGLGIAAAASFALSVDLLSQNQGVPAVIPCFVAVTCIVAIVAVLRRAHGFLLGWAYPAAAITAYFGTNTMLELLATTSANGHVWAPVGCLDGVILVLGVPMFLGVAAAGGIIGARLCRRGKTITAPASIANWCAVAILFTIIAGVTAAHFTPWMADTGGCF
jgi:hypothetical protein